MYMHDCNVHLHSNKTSSSMKHHPHVRVTLALKWKWYCRSIYFVQCRLSLLLHFDFHSHLKQRSISGILWSHQRHLPDWKCHFSGDGSHCGREYLCLEHQSTPQSVSIGSSFRIFVDRGDARNSIRPQLLATSIN